MTPELYNLTPLAPMLLGGLVLALAPLAWVAWRHRQGTPLGRIHALTLMALFLTFDLVLFGAFTRLTDSGLGCPDWPGCYGNASPLGASAHIEAAQTDLPSGPVTQRKAWIEMIHRYLATGVGALILLLTVFSWRARPQSKASNLIDPEDTERVAVYAQRWWAMATLVWVCIQGAFGALTVTMKLFPAIVTLHLLGGMVLLVLLTVQVARLGQPAGRRLTTFSLSLPSPLVLTPSLILSIATTRLLWLAFAALAVQIALGGWVSTNYAVLACNDFPRCQGSFWPPMDFAQGFELWRPLGRTSGAVAAEHINFAALTAIHFSHRAFAMVAALLLGLLAWKLNLHARFRTQSRWLAMLLGLQVATGLANVVLNWPLLAAILHTGGAAALVVVMTSLACVVWMERAGVTSDAGRSGTGWGVAA
jgi:cytochrome c oxidase assembly protein subunit 15